MNEKEQLELQIREAEAFWCEQKRLAANGVINHQMNALAMGNLNELHAKACALNYRDLLDPAIVNRPKTKREIIFGQ